MTMRKRSGRYQDREIRKLRSALPRVGEGRSFLKTPDQDAQRWQQNAHTKGLFNRGIWDEPPGQIDLRLLGRTGFYKGQSPGHPGPSCHQQTACHITDLPGDEARLLRSEIEDKVRHLRRSAEPPQGRLLDLAPVRVYANGLHHGKGVDQLGDGRRDREVLAHGAAHLSSAARRQTPCVCFSISVRASSSEACGPKLPSGMSARPR